MAITVLGAFIVIGIASGLPLNEHCFGMVRSHLGRGAGPMVPAWTFYALFQGIILALFVCQRVLGWEKQTDRVLCLMFAAVFLWGILLQNLPHRVVFPEDERVVVIPRHEQILMWYLWYSNALYGVFGSNDD